LLCGAGAPGVGWRRDQAAERRHGVASPIVVMVCSVGYRVGGTARRSLATMVAAARCAGEEGAGQRRLERAGGSGAT
jgi:hypothetical protein